MRPATTASARNATATATSRKSWPALLTGREAISGPGSVGGIIAPARRGPSRTDGATNIVELAESKRKRKAIFTDSAEKTLEKIEDLVMKNLEETASLLEKEDSGAIGVIYARHGEIDLLIKEATEQHLERFYQKACRAEAGPIFVDILVNLERVSHHCRIIAEYIEGLDRE
jgi:hypothetical protein